MAIDLEAFERAYTSRLTRASVHSDRQAASDVVEAKANVVIDRILASGQQELKEIETLDDPIKEEARELTASLTQTSLIPPRELAGLEDPNIVLDESQVAAIKIMAQSEYGCMIGAAGSGKTTVTKYFLSKIIYGDEELGIAPMPIVQLSGGQGLNIALCAFTGIATQVIKQNMPEWLHGCCKTIHSLLEYKPVVTEVAKPDGSFKEVKVFLPTRHAANKFDYDVIIVDEASMLGVDLWHQILDAARKGTRIYLIGDLNQLLPVASPSMFVHPLAHWKVGELTHIHRQKEPSANKIIDVAHAILKGKKFEFDDPSTNVDWRVIGFQLDNDPMKAGRQIISICNQLRTRKVHASIDPTEPLVYDPYRDRIITTGNGYDENNSASMIQQYWINETLANVIQPPSEDHPRYVIEIDRGGQKRFAVHHRVMATKNESPDTENRVTNGMVGVIRDIWKNPAWAGDHSLVGPEHLVLKARKEQAERILYGTGGADPGLLNELAEMDFGNLNLSAEDLNGGSADDDSNSREGGGPASHCVQVEFANGATRTFSNKAGVGSLQLAYASTCHKCQGSQFDTAIVVVHHVAKAQLNREWLYTAVTRAQKRVVFLYTPFGVNVALAKQRIFGSTLQEKIKRYVELNNETYGMGYAKSKVRLYI